MLANHYTNYAELLMYAHFASYLLCASYARVTVKAPLMKETMGNHDIKSTSLEKTQTPVSGFC